MAVQMIVTSPEGITESFVIHEIEARDIATALEDEGYEVVIRR